MKCWHAWDFVYCACALYSHGIEMHSLLKLFALFVPDGGCFGVITWSLKLRRRGSCVAVGLWHSDSCFGGE